MCKRLFLIVAVALLSFLLVSCNSGSDSDLFPDEMRQPEESLNPDAPLPPETSPPPSSTSPSPASPTPAPQLPPLPQPQPQPLEGLGIPGVTPDELTELWRRTDGSTATIPLTVALNNTLVGGKSQPPVHNTTSAAYYYLIHGQSDLIFVTRPSEDELASAAARGVELEVIPIVKDALVFLVNVENPVENITLRQVRDIYLGEITNWRALGGIDERIIPYQRTLNSGSQTLLLRLVMAGREPMVPPSNWIAGSMGELIEVVSSFDNSREAIGYSMFYFVNNMFGNDQFKLLSIGGVKPSRDTIMSGEYPIEDHYYAVIRKDTPQDHPARILIDWLLTDDGQVLASRAGYIPLRPIEGVWQDESIDPIYLGEVNYSSGTGGTSLKTDVRDVLPVNGVRPPLSRLFYTGINYIQFINSEIIEQLGRVIDDYAEQPTWGDMFQMRTFTGIPNDYPNYEINYMGSLFIMFPEGNPFFGRAASFYIPLTEDMSPYGVGIPEVARIYDYAGRIMPQVDLFTVSINLRGRPEVSARINETLELWYGTFFEDLDNAEFLSDFVAWYTGNVSDVSSITDWAYRLQPSVEMWGDYLSVSYILQLFDGPSFEMPMFRTICFDVRSGNIVDLAWVLSLDSLEASFSSAAGFTRADFSRLTDWAWPVQENMPEGYLPRRGSDISAAWILHGCLNIQVTEPGGRVLQFIFWE